MFLAQNKQQGAEMLQYFVSEEARKASSENTIFRLNSIGSKMFKFYSKLVGTKYLWFTLARGKLFSSNYYGCIAPYQLYIYH